MVCVNLGDFEVCIERCPHLRGVLYEGFTVYVHSYVRISISTHLGSTSSLHMYIISHPLSTHLQHVPVDKLLFLKSRLRSGIKGQGTLVSSEAGCAHFWNMFSTGSPMGEN